LATKEPCKAVTVSCNAMLGRSTVSWGTAQDGAAPEWGCRVVVALGDEVDASLHASWVHLTRLKAQNRLVAAEALAILEGVAFGVYPGRGAPIGIYGSTAHLRGPTQTDSTRARPGMLRRWARVRVETSQGFGIAAPSARCEFQIMIEAHVSFLIAEALNRGHTAENEITPGFSGTVRI
jgi:hypothetical protein